MLSGLKPDTKLPASLLQLAEAPSLTGAVKELRLLFKPGDLIKGCILEVIPGEGVILGLGDRRVFAQTDIPLARNTEVEFMVQSVEPQITLKIKGGYSIEEWQRGALKNLLTFRSGGYSMLEKLKAALEEIQTEKNPDLPVLKQAITEIILGGDPSPRAWKSMGLGLEAGLKAFLEKARGDPAINNLKGLLLKLLNFPGLTGDKEEVRAVMRDLLHLIEGYQATTLLLSSKGENIFLLPVWFDQGMGWGECQLSIDKEKAGDESKAEAERKPSWEAKFFLMMSYLGMINVHVRAFGKEIRCVFQVEETGKQEFISQELKELTSKLHAIGYSALLMECREAKTQGQKDTSALSNLKDAGNAILNIVV